MTRELLCFDFDGVLSQGRSGHWPLTRLDVTPLRQVHDLGYACTVMTCNTVPWVVVALWRAGISQAAPPPATVTPPGKYAPFSRPAPEPRCRDAAAPRRWPVPAQHCYGACASAASRSRPGSRARSVPVIPGWRR